MIKENKPIEHEGFLGNYTNSSIVVFGAPYDGTASYRPGSRFAPGAIMNEIDGIETYSPYLNKDMADYLMVDLGSMELNFNNTDSVLNKIKSEVSSIVEDNKKVFVIGGEHLVTLPVVDAYINKYPKLHVLQLDAHADLRDIFTDSKLSHATVMRRVHEKINGKLWQFGIRSGTKEEYSFAQKHTELTPFTLDGIENLHEKIGNDPVYLTVDIDVLDPSVIPGTGTPEAGGISFRELLDGLVKLNKLNIVGADLVELSPHYDPSGVSTISACKILREVLLLMS